MDEALAAIQEALGTRPPGRRAGAPSGAEAGELPPGAEDLFGETPQRGAWSGDDRQPRRAANDDRAAIGQMLRGLRRRQTPIPYIIAGIAGLFWAGGSIAAAYLYQPQLQSFFQTVGWPAVVGLTCAVVLPLIIVFVLAHVFRRSQDLRLVSETMAEVAMRLAQPESGASEQIMTVGHAIRREVAAMGDGVERALARAAELEALVHNEVSALERAYNDNEVRIRDLLSELTNQRETLVNQAEQVRNAIASVHLDLSHDITSVGDLVADKVNEVAQRVTRSLTERGEHITLALGHAGDSVIDALSERGSVLLDRLETTGDRATTAIASASEHLAASLNFKSEHVHNEFAELAVRLQQMMSSRLDQVAHGFAQKATATIESMGTRSQSFTDALAETGNRIADTILARADEVNATMRATSETLANDLSERGSEVIAKLEQTGGRISDTIVTRSNTVGDTFRDAAEALVNALDVRGEAVRDMLVARLEAFEDMFNRGGTELSEKVARDSSTLGTLITRHITEFDHTVKTYGGELVERLGQRTQDVSEAMRSYVDLFDERVTARTGALSSTLDQQLAQFEDRFGARVATLTSDLATCGKDVFETLDTRIETAAGAITARGSEAADAIVEKTAHLDKTLGARALEVAQTLADRTAALDKTLGARAMEVADNLDSRIGRFEDLLVGRAETVTNQIETRTKAAADALHSRMEELSTSIKTNSDEAERSLRQLAATTTDAIRTSAGEAERTLLGVSSEVARGFIGKADEIAAQVTQRTNEMTTVLSDKSGSVLSAIAEKGEKFAGIIIQATDSAIKDIEDRGLSLARAMMDNSVELTRMINTAGENASGTVNRTLSELHETAQKAIDRSKETATASVKEMMETHNILRTDTTALFERLREANIMLQEVLTGAHENMGAIENTLMQRVTEFVTATNEMITSTSTATNRVETNIGSFRDIATRIVGDLGQLADQFDSHGRELAQAADHIDKSNRFTAETVGERRAALDSLVSTLETRSSDLDQRLTRFSGLLDESLEAATARARDIARIVSESSAEGSRALTEQYGRVRTNAEDVTRLISERATEGARTVADQYQRMREHAEEERQRTAEAMRAVYIETTTDTQAMFREATERFTEVVHGMKQMAGEMQRELEVTRSEMRRGIFELPQETAESTAQMRRVIVGQIEALAELNRIVARHGSNFGVVEPTTTRPRAEPALAGANNRAEQPPPRQAAPPTDVSSFMPPSGRRGAPEGPQPVPQPGAANRGWLTELLERASREDDEPNRDMTRDPSRGGDERSPRHSIESLDSLSVDIARMIDHEAAADLWLRYKRGERNVFTRRLYTLQGQRAFDEIGKKYRGDREFKQTVDRYIAEFERLLDEVSRDDRGQVVTRTYLTSETGKVYTMLAHAAGRFD